MGCLGVELALDSDRQASAAASPVEIGCVNVIPKCDEWTGKHPVYENMAETYAAINNYLAESPLEGMRLLDVNQRASHRLCINKFICIKALPQTPTRLNSTHLNSTHLAS